MEQIGNQVVAFPAIGLAVTSQCLPMVALGGMKLAEILANHSQLIPDCGALWVGPGNAAAISPREAGTPQLLRTCRAPKAVPRLPSCGRLRNGRGVHAFYSLDYAWMRTSVSLWFAASLAVVMLVGLMGAFNTTFFVVVFLVGCVEFVFIVSLLSVFSVLVGLAET